MKELEKLTEENWDKFRDTEGGLYNFVHFTIKKMIRECKPSRKKPNILKKIDQKNFDLVDKVFYEKGFNDGVSQFLKNLKDKYGINLKTKG